MNKLNKWVNLMLVDEDPNYYYCIAYVSLINNVSIMFHCSVGFLAVLQRFGIPVSWCWRMARQSEQWESTILLISH